MTLSNHFIARMERTDIICGRKGISCETESCRTRQIYPWCYYQHRIKNLHCDQHSTNVIYKVSDERNVIVVSSVRA